MIQAYYESENVKLFCADCLEVLPQLGQVDAVVTDPPYGIARVWKGGRGHGWGTAREQSPVRNQWDESPPSTESIDTLVTTAPIVVIWGGNYFVLPVSRGWLVWNKPERNFSLAEAELAWTNRDMPIRVLDCLRSENGREHPTQKPLRLMKWAMDVVKIPVAATVLDPYMGSGTTGVACIRTGRKFVGIEIDESYCAIAERRIREAESQLTLDLEEARR